MKGGSPRGVMVKGSNYGLEPQSCYYVLFRINTLGKGIIIIRCILTFDPAKNAIHGDAAEGSDTF